MSISKLDAMKKSEYITIVGASGKVSRKEIIETLSKCSKGKNLSFTLFFNNISKKWVFMESNQIPYNISRVATIKDTININSDMFRANQEMVDYLYKQIKIKIRNIKHACSSELKKLQGKGVNFTKKDIDIIYTFMYKKETKVI